MDKAVATQLANIEAKTGRTREALVSALRATNLTKHGEMRAWAMEQLGLGHGDANLVAHLALGSAGTADPEQDIEAVLASIYTGKKAHQRPIHDKLMAAIAQFGEFEIAPKKGYVSLRRKKQFAMLGPKTNDRFELGLNIKEDLSHPRVTAQAPGGMCQYIAALATPEDVDAALLAIVKRAYDAAG